MTAGPPTCADRTAVDPEELRANLRQADPGVLVAVLAQLTGDPAVVDTFGPKISHVPDPPERAGVTDPVTAEALVDAVVAAVGARPPAGGVRDPEMFRRAAAARTGCRGGRRVRSAAARAGRFSAFPADAAAHGADSRTTTVAIIGAGLAGIITALAAADAGVDYQIIDRNDEVGGTWLTTAYPGIGVDTPSAYYSLSRDVNPRVDELLPAGRGVSELPGVAGRQIRAARRTPDSAPRSRPCGGTRTARSGRSARWTGTGPATSAMPAW